MKENEPAPAVAAESPKQAANQFLQMMQEGAASIHLAAEHVLRDLATHEDSTWTNGMRLSLDPNEAVILRMAGILLGEGPAAATEIARQVHRVRTEVENRKIYKGKAALAEAQRIAEETAKKERQRRGELEDVIRVAQEEMSALGAATAAAQKTVEQMQRSKEILWQHGIPPFIAQRAATIHASINRGDAKKRVIELEGRWNVIKEAELRISDRERTELYNKENPGRTVKLGEAPPSLTNQQLQDRETLPSQILAAKKALKELSKDADALLDEFIEYGLEGKPAEMGAE